MSSITQIIVTCAFSVLACVLRCAVRIHKEKAVNLFCFGFFYLLFGVIQESLYLVFWLLLFCQFNASVTENGIIEMLEKQQKKELHWSSIFYYKRYEIRISLYREGRSLFIVIRWCWSSFQGCLIFYFFIEIIGGFFVVFLLLLCVFYMMF